MRQTFVLFVQAVRFPTGVESVRCQRTMQTVNICKRESLLTTSVIITTCACQVQYSKFAITICYYIFGQLVVLVHRVRELRHCFKYSPFLTHPIQPIKALLRTLELPSLQPLQRSIRSMHILNPQQQDDDWSIGYSTSRLWLSLQYGGYHL